MEAQLFVFAAVAISEVFSACSPKNTKFKNFQKAPKRSIRYKIGVSSKKCPGIDEFYYRWTVQQIPGKKTLRSTSEPSISIDGYSFPSYNCFSVEYLVTVKVSHYPDMTYADEVKDTFRFVPDNMRIEILGGFEKPHLVGEDLVLDAKTISRDLSYGPNEDAFDGNKVRWTVPTKVKGFTPPNKLIITLPAKLLGEGTYEFKVVITRTKIPNYVNVAEAIQTVKIIPKKFPQLNILCLRNCIYPHHNEITVFTVNCTRNCGALNYIWFLEPAPDEMKIDFGTGHDKLIILNGAYKEGEKLKVNVRSGSGFFTLLFNYVTGLEKGRCSIDPKEGISAVTQFKINCSGHYSPYGIVIYNVYQKLKSGYLLLNEDSYYEECEVYLTANKKASIVIEVVDNAYLNTWFGVFAVVRRFQPQEKMAVQSAVKQLVLSTDLTSITSYSLEGFHNEAVQLIAALMETMTEIKMDNGTKKDLHKHMAEALNRIEPEKFAIAFQTIQIVKKLDWFRLPEDTVTAELLARAIAHATLHVHEMHNHEHDRNIPQTLIENFFRETLQPVSRFLKKSPEILEVLTQYTPVHDYDSYDEYVSRKIQIRDDFRKIMRNILVTMKINCITMLYRALPDEKPKFYKNDDLTIRTQRKTIDILQKTILNVADGNKKTTLFLPVEMMKELKQMNYFVDFQTVIFRENPFWWDMNATTLNTPIILFDLFVKCTRVKKMRSPFYIEFAILSLPKQVNNGTLTDRNVAAYKIQLGAYQTLIVRFEKSPNQHTAYKVTWADCFCTDQDFESKRSKVISNSYNSTEELLQIRHDEDTQKTVFVCIKKLTNQLSYAMTLTTFSCVHWDLDIQAWSGEGCRVKHAELDFNKPLVCECHHRSLYAGMIATPPNTLTLDKDIDFTIDFVKNSVMIYIVSTILALYIISLIFAHIRDKAMKKSNVVHKLDDNVPGDRYAYLVVFFTGFYYDAPTTADVSFQLVGYDGRSRVHLIKCKGFKLLQRNTQDWFTLYSPSYLGRLKKIKIWHNCRGKSPHWYCERVIVQDLQTAEQYCFTVKKWFSVTWGRRKTFRIIPLKLPPSKIRQMSFLTHLERDMRNNHIWIGAVVRDFQSNFNSKERVSAGFCFVFSSMIANVLLSSVPSGAPSDSIDKESRLFLDTAKIIIYFESWLVASAVVLIIIFFFKNSRPL